MKKFLCLLLFCIPILYSNPITGQITCNAEITASLDFIGDVSITAEDIVEGTFVDGTLVSLDDDNYQQFIHFDCESIGTYVVYAQLPDASATCMTNVTIIDAIDPIAIANPAVYLYLVNGSTYLTVEMVDDGSYDNCTSVALTLSQTVFTIDDLGSNTETMTVLDDYGNASIVFYEVIVNDGSSCSIDDVVNPLANINLTDEYYLNNNSPQDLIEYGGFSPEDVHFTWPDSCTNFVWSYSDQVINQTNGIKIVRTFWAVDFIQNLNVSFTQIIVIGDLIQNVACIDMLAVSYQGSPITIYPQDVLAGGPYDYSVMDLEITFEGNVVVDNIITEEYVWDTLLYTVINTTNGNSCWGHIVVSSNQPCNITEDDIQWPLDVTVPSSETDPFIMTPVYMEDVLGLDSSLVHPQLIIPCELIGETYEDIIFENDIDQWQIFRQWTVLDWTSSAVYEYTQLITNGADPSSLICDTLDHTTPVGDCDSGHTLEDDVEWPANIIISDHRISPDELIIYSGIDSMDANPTFYSSPNTYTSEYLDILLDLTPSAITLKRLWTVTHNVYGYQWNFDQQIIVNISDFNNRVVINSLDQEPVANVVINNNVLTNENGYATVEGPINTVELYDLQPEGVNILDLVLLEAHVLGQIQLDESIIETYADVNQDGYVSTLDIVILSKVLMQLQGLDWVFEDITDQTDPNVRPKAHYTGFVPGDVDQSGNDSIINPTEYENLSYRTNDLLLNQGELYEVPFKLNTALDLSGYEFNIGFDAELINILDVNVDQSNIDLTWDIQDGQLHIIGVFSEGNTYDDETSLFTLRVEAQENSLLSLAFRSESMNSLLVTEDFKLLKLDQLLENVITTSTQDFATDIFKMYPNPASDVVILDGIEGEIIYVFDQNGRQMLNTTTNNIDVSTWPQGIYYFHLETGDSQQTEILQVIQR